MLKKIILEGFKSFADAVTVDFSDGVTSVIGPNGSGKSNISDGIRWVLGEQSPKNLRGSKLDDVIFAGAVGRKPGSFAKVSLVLDNTKRAIQKIDAPEIEVTRCTYRGGRSEFYINREPVLLRDIHNLFLDSGIGSNSYSIISQGQVEKILSTKKEDRRLIFEEAAGIVKLKNNKEHAEVRLKEIESDQERISDILHELEKQLTPLKKQAIKAKKYKELKYKLESLEIGFLTQEIHRLNTDKDNFKDQRKNLELEISLQKENLNNLNKKLKDLKLSSQSADEELFLLQDSYAKLKELIEKNRNELILRNERIANSEEKIKNNEKILKERENNLNFSIEDYNFKKENLSKNQTKISRIQPQIDNEITEILNLEEQISNLEKTIEEKRTHSIDLYNENSKLKLEIEQKNGRLCEFTERLSTLNKKTSEEQENIQRLTKTLADKTKTIKENQFQNEKKTMDLKEKEQQLIQTLNDIETFRNQENKWKEQLIEKTLKKDNLAQLIDNHDDFYLGVRSILKAKKENKISGVYGTVIDLFDVQDGYESALGNLIKPYEQYLVVEDEEVVKTCITYLNENKAGMATFVPLTLISSSSFSESEKSILNNYPEIQKALGFIKCQPEFESIFSFLLGRSLISTSLEDALFFMKHNKKFNTRIATLSGEILRPGTISGGKDNKKKENRLEKRKELNLIEKECLLLQNKLAEEQEKIIKFQANQHELKIEIQNLKREIEQEQQHHAEDLKDIQKSTLELEMSQTKAMQTEDEVRQIENTMSSFLIQVKKIEETLENQEKNYFSLYQMLQNDVDVLQRKKQEFNERNENKNQLLLNIAKLNQENTSLSSYLDQIGDGHESLQQYIEEIQSNISKEKEYILEINKEIEDLIIEKNQLLEKANLSSTNIEETRVSIKDFHFQEETQEKELQLLSKEIHKLEQKINELNVCQGKNETEKDNTLSRLLEEYQLTEEQLDFKNISDFIYSKKEKMEVQNLKKEISDLGTINHAAIEDSEQLEVRFLEEKKQFEDIKKAREDLLLLVGNLESEMKNLFLNTFEKISSNFSNIFSEMFDGGHAKLTLENLNDPLNSPIEIVSQPPGKKMQNISSLSGGEKAFTAVSLIFAIIQAKPSPFVILDEVDAPLDDANVFRYAYFLKKMSENNQFIVVTHRKGTMMISDFLYGVTLVQNGVSTVFPHRLDVQEVDAHA